MPFYTFQCYDDKEHIFDSWAPVSDMSYTTPCVSCGKLSKRLLSNFNFVGSTKFGDAFKELEIPLGRKFNSSKEVDKHLKNSKIGHVGDSRLRGKK